LKDADEDDSENTGKVSKTGKSTNSDDERTRSDEKL